MLYFSGLAIVALLLGSLILKKERNDPAGSLINPLRDDKDFDALSPVKATSP